MLICGALAISPVSAIAQDGGAQSGQPPQQSADPNAGSAAGGAEFGTDPNALPRNYVPGTEAVLLEDGLAAAPADAPVEVQEAIFAANELQTLPYKYGGGHKDFEDDAYDCSGTVSFALNAAGLLKRPLDSSSFMKWGERGKGDWITVYTNPGHAYVIIAGLRLDTSSAGDRARRGKGPRWRSTARAMRGFRARHPEGF